MRWWDRLLMMLAVARVCLWRPPEVVRGVDLAWEVRIRPDHGKAVVILGCCCQARIWLLESPWGLRERLDDRAKGIVVETVIAHEKGRHGEAVLDTSKMGRG